MLKYGNKEFRNLQEQVEKNMEDIQFILEEEGVLNQFGIKVIGQEEDVADLPTVAEYKEAHEDWAYGDAYAIGEEDPYALYILTRANGSHPNDYWFEIGEFPVPGPQGETGEQGPIGVTPSISVSASTSTLSPGQSATVSVTKTGTDANPSLAFSFGIPQGAQGIQGAQGPKGADGLTTSISVNGSTYTQSSGTITLPDLAEVSQVVGTYPEYIDATIASGLAGSIDWGSIQDAIESEDIDFKNHTFNTYLYFYFPNILTKYGLGESSSDPGYIAVYDQDAPITMPDSIVDFNTLKAWLLAKIETLWENDNWNIDEVIISNSIAQYTVASIDDLTISASNDNMICEASLECTRGEGETITGATNPPTEPGLEYNIVGNVTGNVTGDVTGNLTGNVNGGTIEGLSVGTVNSPIENIYATTIGSKNSKVFSIYAQNIGDGYSGGSVTNIYTSNISATQAYSSRVFTNSISSIGTNNINITPASGKSIQLNSKTGDGLSTIGNIEVSSSGVTINGDVDSSGIGRLYEVCNTIYMQDAADENSIGLNSSNGVEIYIENGYFKLSGNIPTSDPQVAGAVWNDNGILKISAGV